MTDVRRRFLVAAGLGAALATILFVLVLQSGRAGVFDRDLLGNFYDGQGRALLDGHIDVDPDIPGFEGFRIGDETHIYQGIAPTLVRLPLLAATDRFDGRLTGVSMTLGFIASMASVIAAAWRLRRITRGDAPIGRLELACTTIATFGIGGGSLLFLASKAWVYHEALIWGTATCLASLTFLLYWLDGRRAADTTADSGDADSGGADSGERSTGRGFATLVPAVVLAGVTLNTRTSVGLGPIAALGLVSLCLLLGLVTRRRAPDDGDPGDETPGWAERVSGWTPARSTTAPAASLVVVVVGVLLSVVLYAGVNQARFGSAFSVPLDRQALVANDVARQEALAANDNSLFGLQYVPSVLLQVVRPDAIGVRNAFPYLGFPEQRPAVVGDAVFAELDWSASVPASQPMLFLAGLIGLVVLIAPRRFVRGTPDAGDGVAVARIPVVGAAVGGSVIVVFGYIAQRYVTDLFPVAALAGLVGLTALGTRLAPRPASTDGGAADRPTDDRPTGDRPTDRRWALVAGVAVLVVTSLWTVWANAGMALQYGNEVAPGRSEADRAAWLELQERLGGSFDVVAVDPDDELPPAGPVGQLAVVGDCDGLYRSNGTVWYLIESGEAEDGLRLSVARDGELGAPLTLLGTQGAGARLVLEPLGGDVVRLVVEVDRPDGIQRSLVGAEFELPDASTTPLDVSFDRRTDDVVVTGPDSEVLRVQIDLPEGAVTPGGTPPGGAAAAPDAAAPDAAVTVTVEGSATPLCDRILR